MNRLGPKIAMLSALCALMGVTAGGAAATAATDSSEAETATESTGDASAKSEPAEAGTSSAGDEAAPATPAEGRLDARIEERPASRVRPGAGARVGDARAANQAAVPGRIGPCTVALPAPGPSPFLPGETLAYDLDIMGVRAGVLTMSTSRDQSEVWSFSATTRTNTFFSNVRDVRGSATSYARKGGFTPARFSEDALEDGVRKWAEVMFPEGRGEVDVRFGIGNRERRVRYPAIGTPHDLLSIVYHIRSLDLSLGQELCVDIYGNRRVWRLQGSVADEEFIRTPAGGFATWRISGTATRSDMPTSEREVHIWIAQDERRTPVAAMGSIDLGPVRARLSRLEDAPGGQQRRPDYGGGRW